MVLLARLFGIICEHLDVTDQVGVAFSPVCLKTYESAMDLVG